MTPAKAVAGSRSSGSRLGPVKHSANVETGLNAGRPSGSCQGVPKRTEQRSLDRTSQPSRMSSTTCGRGLPAQPRGPRVEAPFRAIRHTARRRTILSFPRRATHQVLAFWRTNDATTARCYAPYPTDPVVGGVLDGGDQRTGVAAGARAHREYRCHTRGPPRTSASTGSVPRLAARYPAGPPTRTGLLRRDRRPRAGRLHDPLSAGERPESDTSSVYR